MSVLECKSINLLNFCPLKEVKLDKIKSDITCICYNTTKKIFADVAGNVHVYTSKWEEITTFQAHSNAIKLCDITPSESMNMLVTLEQNPNNNKIFLQVFDLNVIKRREGPQCGGTAKLSSASAATVIRVQPIGNQLCVVIGFDLGNLMVYRAQLNRDMSSQFRNVNVCLGSITCMEFVENGFATRSLFVCSQVGIFCYTVTDGNMIADTKNVLDAKNVATPCCTMRRVDGELYYTVGREDAVYCYTGDGRGPCYGIKGQKQLIAWFGNRLIIVNKTYGHAAYVTPQQDDNQLTQLIVIDVENKIIVYHKAMPAIVKIIVDNYNCYIVTATKEIYALVEHDIQSKVRLLIKKKLYDVALNLLKGTDNSELLAEVNMQYGNYFLAKGDLSDAVGKYVKTIGQIESYRVIQNLLDSRYNKYLAEYLRALVQSVYATPDHLELLRCCTEREDLPLKIKDIFDNDKAGNQSDVNGILAIECTHMNLQNFIEILQDHSNACNRLSSWSDQQIYDCLTEHWSHISTKHLKDLLEFIKSLIAAGRFVDFVERITILLSDQSACIELLEHAINHINDEENHEELTMMRNALVDLYLREWQRGNKTTAEVLQVLDEQKQHLNVEQLLFECKRFKFWDGILALDDSNAVRRLCLLQQSNRKIDINDWNPELWLEALEDNENFFDKTNNKTISSVLKSLLHDKQQSLMQLMRNFSDNERITVGQIREIFTHGSYLQNLTNMNQQRVVIADLQKQLNDLKQLLENYSTRPIEFRSNLCDSCKKQIKPPALYYVCQHAYHKECITGYSANKSCIACLERYGALNSDNIELTDIDVNDMTIEAVAKYLSLANTKTTYDNPQQQQQLQQHQQQQQLQPQLQLQQPQPSYQMNVKPVISAAVSGGGSGSSNAQQWHGRFNIKESKKPQNSKASLNPFDDEDDDANDNYDANLNPFA